MSSTCSSDGFTSEALLLAMAPIDLVLDTFVREIEGAVEEDQNHLQETWSSMESQQRFASLLKSHWNERGPSGRYLRRLTRRFVARVEEVSIIENDDLMELILKCSLCNDSLPDPEECGYLSFCVPPNKNEVRLRVYPQHNNVGLLKAWEAGACLAEFLLEYPTYVCNKRVVELGAGVGLTALIAAGCCHARQVHMTDYATVILENLQHNINVNTEWLQFQRPLTEDPTVTMGFLEFGSKVVDADETEEPTDSNNASSLVNADVILAADVAYDIKYIPSLVQTVCSFIFRESRPCAIFATTFRNKETFDALERELVDNGCLCNYVDSNEIEKLPRVFPCYFLQPRTDVRICIVTAGEKGAS